MGTSASYSGPKGKNPLIPPWAETPGALGATGTEPDITETSEEQNGDAAPPTPQSPNIVNPSTLTPWNEVKTNFTQYAKSSGFSSPRYARRVARSFVKAQGGASNAATSSRKGRSVAQNIGGVFAGLVKQGSDFTYNGFSFKDCIGKKTSELLETFVDLVTEHTDDLESTIAREAAVETFQKLFELLGVDEKGFEALQNISGENLKVMFQTYLSEYIFASMLQKVGQTLEKLSPKEAHTKEKWLRNFISTKVSLNMENTDLMTMDWKGETGKRFTDDIFTQAYKLMETA